MVTLPNCLGIEKATVFYDDIQKKKDSIALSAIADFEISSNSSMENGVCVNIFNAAGDAIEANYIVAPSPVAKSKSSLLASTYQICGSVTAGNIVKNYDFTVENSGDHAERVAAALNTGSISKKDALDLYLDICATGSVGECGTFIMAQLMNLCEDTDFMSQLSAEKQGALRALTTYSITYTNERFYRGVSGADRIAVYYEDDGKPDAPKIIKDIHKAFMDTEDTFCGIGGLGYDKPLTPDYTTFNVYTTSSACASGSSIAAWAPPYANGKSCIEVFNISLTSTTITLSLKGILAHEYFHCITHTYRDMTSLQIASNWFVESIATWASYKQYGSSYEDMIGEINTFLNGNNSSLTNRTYGAVLFPFFMQIYRGGDNAVKNMLVYLKTYPSYDIYQVINTITSASGGFQGSFAEFWVRNYTPRASYSTYSTSAWLYEPGDITVYASPSTSYGVSTLACRFIEYPLKPSGSNTNVTVNVFSGLASEIRNYALFRTSSGTSYAIDISPYTGSLVTFVVPSGYTVATIVSMNTGRSSMIGCQVTIS